MKLQKFLRLVLVLAWLTGCAAMDSIFGTGVTGTWYYNGRTEEIYQREGGLEARNDAGSTTRLLMDGSSAVVALDWNNLRGEIRNDRIEWANGTTWTRNR